MKAKELIELLQKLDPETLILVDHLKHLGTMDHTKIVLKKNF